MAATAAQLGIKAPAGGFKDGGWYEGRNYDAASGTFGDPGVIWSKSLPNSGTKVSSEVNQQSSVAQGLAPNAIDTYIRGSSAIPKSAPAITPFLNEYQNNLFGDGGGPETRVQSLSEISNELKSSGILPSGAPPTPPSLVEQFGALKEQAGVDAIQQSIIDLKAQQDAIATQLQVNKTAENGKPVAKNVIQGRISQEEQQAQDQYDFIGRQLSRKQDELNAALGNIQMIMQFSQTDYQNAAQAYNTQFDQAISTINLVRGIQQDQKTDQQRAIDNARANAQIFVNAIQKGNLDINSLDPAAQAQLNTLEVQAGLPVGFFGALRMDADANVLFTNTNNGVTQVGIRNADGSVSVQSYGTPSSGSDSASLTKQIAADKAIAPSQATQDARNKMTLGTMMALYQQYGMSKQQIYDIYVTNTSYKQTDEIRAADKARYGVK